MGRSSCILVFLLATSSYQRYCESNNKISPIPSKIKLYQNKARVVQNKFKVEQSKTAEKQSAPSTSILIPRISSASLPVYELFIRSKNTFWVRFRDILGEDALIQEKSIQLANGGTDAESARDIVDAWIAVSIFGKGYGA